MNTPLLAGAGLLMTSALIAQTATSNFVGYDSGTADTATRFSAPAGTEVDIIQRIQPASIVGAGTAGGDTFRGVRVVLQDTDLTTPEVYNLVFYTDDGTGMPDLANPPLRSGNLSFPLGGTAFRITVTFGSPVAVPAADFYYGIGLASTVANPSDGLAIQGALYTGAGRVSNPNAQLVTYAVDPTGGTVIGGGGQAISMSCDLITDGPGLKPIVDVDTLGTVMGAAAHWQDRSRNDGFGFQLTDGASPGASYAILGSIFGPASPLSLGFLDGDIYLDTNLLFPTVLAAGTLDPTGAATVLTFPAPLTLSAPIIQFTTQAVVDVLAANGAPRLSNGVVIYDN